VVTGALVEALATESPAERLLIADPFAGGGVIALAALIRGHRVYAQDVNPWASRCLVTMLDLPTVDELGAAADRLHDRVADILEDAYGTSMSDGTRAEVATTLRVATGACPHCGEHWRLFPAALVSLTQRVDCGGNSGFVACSAGHVNEATVAKSSRCSECRCRVDPKARYTTGRGFTCPSCGCAGKLSELAGKHGFRWEVVLVDRVSDDGLREIGPPTKRELAQAAAGRWNPNRRLPAISDGLETRGLRHHGMRSWHDLYPSRQRVVIEKLLGAAQKAADGDERVARALEAAIIGSAEMAGLVSRWDARYLKSYEAIANHRFSFTTLAAEPNVWGAGGCGRGGVDRRLRQFAKASAWLEEKVGREWVVSGPTPTAERRRAMAARLDVKVVEGSSERLLLPGASLDAVLTDPPYHNDVQYADLSSLFRAWAGQSVGALDGDAAVVSKSEPIEDYEDRLTRIFAEARRALKPGGHLVLSYANRHPPAWAALFSALHRAGFRAAGYAVVHSENEVDHAKVGRRACCLDVLIDLVDRDTRSVEIYEPKGRARGPEEAFCRRVGRRALQIGSLQGNWRGELEKALTTSTFLRPLAVSDEA
jgi:putative DNA methylase